MRPDTLVLMVHRVNRVLGCFELQCHEFAGLRSGGRWPVPLAGAACLESALPVVQGGEDQAMLFGVGFCCDCLGFDCRNVAAPVLLGCCHRHARLFSI